MQQTRWQRVALVAASEQHVSVASSMHLLARALYGRRFDHVPKALHVYLRPGERHIRRLQAAWRFRGRILSLDDYSRGIAPREIEEFLACSLCGETRQRPLFRPRSSSGSWEYRVVQCPSCGFLYRNPSIRPARLADLYSSGYSKFLTSDYARNRQLRYVLTMASLRPIFELGTGRRLLDFGCGTGLFLELAEERGFECYGVDLSPDSIVEARARLRTAKTFVGPPTSIPQIAAGNFDVITMWSVLAHLPRPVDDLSMLRGLLAHDGVLVILTVNAASLLVGAGGSAWSGFTKNHLMFYSRQTLPRLLAKAGFAGAGFAPFYGDEVEAGTSRLSAAEVDRLKRRVESTDGGNMLRAVGFATETAMKQWGQSRSPAAPRPMIKQAQPFTVNTGHLRTRPPDVEG
jgi:2-polyprenyl-3-methyl-5-hydroxy-6-metoxy-1,4-benzoquinol methylase